MVDNKAAPSSHSQIQVSAKSSSSNCPPSVAHLQASYNTAYKSYQPNS